MNYNSSSPGNYGGPPGSSGPPGPGTPTGIMPSPQGNHLVIPVQPNLTFLVPKRL